jgi:hypothetical protein
MEGKKCTVILTNDVYKAMDIAFGVAFAKQEKEVVKTKPQQICYALELLRKLVEQGHVNQTLLTKLK